MKKLAKKGAFETINAGMLSFITFIMIVLLAVLLVSIMKTTDTICGGGINSTETYYDGVCYTCVSNTTTGTTFYYNSSDNTCRESGNPGNSVSSAEFGGIAYNGTKNLQDAAALPPQFAQIIVIVVIIVGILGMLAFIGYGAYRKMR